MTKNDAGSYSGAEERHIGGVHLDTANFLYMHREA